MRLNNPSPVIAFCMIMAACNGSSDSAGSNRTDTAKTPSTPDPSRVAKPSVYKSFAGAVLDMELLLGASVLVWPDIDARYEAIKPHLADSDLSNRTKYGTEIKKALEAIKAGDAPKTNTAVVNKGLQHVAVLTILGLLDQAIKGNMREQMKSTAFIEDVFAAIAPTFKKRDAAVYDGVPTLVSESEAAIGGLRSAQNKIVLAGAVMRFSKLLSKAYVLSVLHELKGLKKVCSGPEADTETCAAKRAGAGTYYRIIRPSVEARNKIAGRKIKKLLESEQRVPEIGVVRGLLSSTLSFTVEELTF